MTTVLTILVKFSSVLHIKRSTNLALNLLDKNPSFKESQTCPYWTCDCNYLFFYLTHQRSGVQPGSRFSFSFPFFTVVFAWIIPSKKMVSNNIYSAGTVLLFGTCFLPFLHKHFINANQSWINKKTSVYWEKKRKRKKEKALNNNGKIFVQ